LPWNFTLLSSNQIAPLVDIIQLKFEVKMFAPRFTRLGSVCAKGVRQMSGHHHAAPQGGLDGIVRKYLKEDYQVSFWFDQFLN
jgi:hypothetical protein